MNDEPADLMRETAIAHLSMIYQVATGAATESRDRTERRYLAVTQYLLHGTCAVNPTERTQLAQLHEWLSTQSAPEPLHTVSTAA